MRNTIAAPVKFSGIGLHTGARSSLEIRPARQARGIMFFRADMAGSPGVPARLESVRSTVRGTNLSAGGCEVFTVEHVLSALAAFGVDDADVFMDGPEPPILDGSAKDFAMAVSGAGVARYDAPAPGVFAPGRPVEYREGQVFYRLEPAERLTYAFTYISRHPLVGKQELEFALTPESYLEQIAPARTFGFEEELEMLRKAGLARGGSLENAVVIARDRVLADGGLRFPDELVRHKLLDMIGDFSLLGLRLGPVKISAVCGGHAHNVKFAKMLLEAK